MDLLESLNRLNACGEAVAWASTQPDARTAWEKCPRGDWLLWLAARVGVRREDVVLAACDCAETAAEHWTEDTALACVWAIDAARRWARGKTGLEEVRAAAAAAAAASAAHAAAAYVAAADAADARSRTLAHYADLVRARIPFASVEAALAAREAA